MGLLTGVITCRSMSSSTVFFDSGSKCFGTRLTVVTHIGSALSCNLMFIGLQFIGDGFSSSLSVMSNLLSSQLLMLVSCLFVLTASTVLGK